MSPRHLARALVALALSGCTDGGDGSFGGSGGGPPIDTSAYRANSIAIISGNGDVFVELSNYEHSCLAYHDYDPACGPTGMWRLRFLQGGQPPSGVAQIVESPPGDPATCGGFVSHAYDSGTIEALPPADVDHLKFRISGSAPLADGTNIDGDYDALLCGSQPIMLPQVTPYAVAKASPDGTLTLTLSSRPNTCGDPTGGASCATGGVSVTLSLPPESQVPGTYNVDNQYASFISWEPNEQGICVPETRKYGAFLEVVSAGNPFCSSSTARPTS